jgi:hypothetical protein
MKNLNRALAGSLMSLSMLGGLALSSPAHALVSPIGLSVAGPVQLPPSDFTVAGARASLLWGNHRSVYGFDFSFIGNHTQNSFTGVALAGGYNWNQGTTTAIGLQAAGFANVNINKATIVGLQVAGLINYNGAESTLVGLGAALINRTPHTKVIGAQAGLYNQAREVYGFQFGLINSAESLHGVQLGLLNFNKTGLFAVAPFLNVGF